MGETEGDRQVQVRFITRLPSEYRVEGAAFSLPVYLNRYGLSQIINTLLGLDNPKPFDFLLDGELIRTTLEQLCISKNLSAESVLVLEYILAVGPPHLQSSLPHSDWVSAVSGAHSSLILSGSYDSVARAWFADGTCCSVMDGHKDAITAITLLVLGDDVLDVVTSSKDRTLRLWEVESKVSPDARPVAANCSKIFKGHSASVQCAAASPSGNHICSGSWDSTIKLWKINTDDASDEDDKTSKRRRLEGGEKQPGLEVAASETYTEHTQCVSAVEWPEESSIFSVSWDHSLRQWDVETNVNTVTLSCSKALNCLSVGGEASALVVTGGADQCLRIWDPRLPGTVTPILQLSSHKGWITACEWHRHSNKHLLSASHDGTVKMWDIRSKVPLQTLDAHGDKVLCADWWNNDAIVTGGADSKLNVFKHVNITNAQ